MRLLQALKWHPDRHLDDKERAQEKFIEVSFASSSTTGSQTDLGGR